MGFFADLFGTPKPALVIIIRNVLGEEIDRVEGARDLWGGVDLRGRQWCHADLSGMWLDGSDLTGANLFGTRCVGTSFARCKMVDVNLAYALIEACNFQKADLEGADLLHTKIERTRFDGCMIGPTTTIPGVYAGARREW
jgi:uncharacterized protein YjbI with pentapeptide repeats